MMTFDVHVAILLYLVVGVMALLRVGGGYVGSAIAVLVHPVLVFLHEMGHSLAARKEGVRIRRILLHVLGGFAELRDPIPGPAAEIAIALAGPFVNLLAGGLLLFPSVFFSAPIPAELTFVGELLFLNLTLAFFNLLPIFPMDGGRVATAIAILKLGPDEGIRIMRHVSLVGLGFMAGIGLWMLLLGRFDGAVLLAIGVLLYLQGGQEMQARSYAAQYLSSSAPVWRESELAGEEEAWRASSSEGAASRGEGWFARFLRRRQEAREAKERHARAEMDRRLDEILAKVKREGIGSLAPEERDLLHRASRTYRGKESG